MEAFEVQGVFDFLVQSWSGSKIVIDCTTVEVIEDLNLQDDSVII
jgi:hypothetical protein